VSTGGSIPSSPVAVIDIGSNSIKLLVATRTPAGGLTPLVIRTLDARIGAGIGGPKPQLGAAGMALGLDAIATLLADAAAFAPTTTILVATSAVRDAQNGADFCDQVRTATGHAVRILTGDEEARLVGRGLTCDPALRSAQDFYVFDLGGGSLECLAFRAGRIEQAASLPLGCVRLTERFVADPSAPLTAPVHEAIGRHARAEITAAGFRFSLPAAAVAVGTGGTVTTVRAILGARAQTTFEATDPIVTVADLIGLRDQLGAMPLAERQRVAGLPPKRADVFPAALTTLIAVAELGGFAAYRNSVCNLRHGVAAEALGVS